MTFFFLHLKLRRNCYKKQEKSSKKFCFSSEKFCSKILIFFHRRFLTAVFFGGKQFSPNVKPYSNWPFKFLIQLSCHRCAVTAVLPQLSCNGCYSLDFHANSCPALDVLPCLSCTTLEKIVKSSITNGLMNRAYESKDSFLQVPIYNKGS